ncbi:MFS transporter [Tianweitania sp. BSSL-BM11]|uniref:MFS transporter n=1 Tax=Tianweitania aestuarii TaxID=2814886 RepID=A0ABS5RSS1_9HYPH|nr:MFS transporter [Tianweitania aestuarii]
MIILLLAGFMNLIDVNIVNVALPSLQRNLEASPSQIEWVVAAYILAFAIGLLPFGRLGDRIGRKRMFLLGVSGFTLFSALCGMAPSINWLVAARALQGFSGAMMMPQVLAIVQVIFPPHERGAAFSFFGLSAGLASVAGPLAGGLLINADIAGLDWRPIFLVNIPVGIIALIAAQIVVPSIPGDRTIKNDTGGTLLAGASVFLIIFALIEGRGFGWPIWIFGLVALALVGFGCFYAFEHKREKTNKAQLLPAHLLSNSNYMLGGLMVVLFFSGVAGFFMVLALFLQSGLGFTPLQSGLSTIPFPVGVLLISLVNNRLGSRFLRQRVAAGTTLLVGAMLWLRIVLPEVTSFADHWTIAPGLFLGGVGLGGTISSLFQSVLANVPTRDAGSGSGALQSFQQMGAAFGVAIVGQIFFMVLDGQGGTGDRVAYAEAIRAAISYEFLAFGSVAILVTFFLKAPKEKEAHGTVHHAPVAD